MSSRAYIKRIWRVPKDRGATEYLASLVTKALVKHGWPATWRPSPYDPWSFVVDYKHPTGRSPGADFWQAVEVAVRIVARTYRLEVSESEGLVTLNRFYSVSPTGQFKESKP